MYLKRDQCIEKRLGKSARKETYVYEKRSMSVKRKRPMYLKRDQCIEKRPRKETYVNKKRSASTKRDPGKKPTCSK